MFEEEFIGKNRGKNILFVYCTNLQFFSLEHYTQFFVDKIEKILDFSQLKFHFLESQNSLTVGVALEAEVNQVFIADNLDAVLLKIHAEIMTHRLASFDLGTTISRCSRVADTHEILQKLEEAAIKNFYYHTTELRRRKFNNIDSFLIDSASVVIQPMVKYDPIKEDYSIAGGEVFIGGPLYGSYYSLMEDIPENYDKGNIDLLLLEKMIAACQGLPGMLKFNVAPQFLINVLNTPEKIKRLHALVLSVGLDPHKVRFELTEHSYEEKDVLLHDVCGRIWEYGISFAADDFGAKSSSHQVILDLGVMIKEIKIVPMSFQFKPDQDYHKFLDNLSFIEYCMQLASNRGAIITAEAAEDFTTIEFLLSHQIFYFQTNLFFGKISLCEYKDLCENRYSIGNTKLKGILTDSEILVKQKKLKNLNKLISV